MNITITGRITDGKSSQPLVGCNVYTLDKVGGKTIGTETNSNGEYKIIIPRGYSLVYSYIGYQQIVSKPFQSSTEQNFRMVEKVELLPPSPNLTPNLQKERDEKEKKEKKEKETKPFHIQNTNTYTPSNNDKIKKAKQYMMWGLLGLVAITGFIWFDKMNKKATKVKI